MSSEVAIGLITVVVFCAVVISAVFWIDKLAQFLEEPEDESILSSQILPQYDGRDPGDESDHELI